MPRLTYCYCIWLTCKYIEKGISRFISRLLWHLVGRRSHPDIVCYLHRHRRCTMDYPLRNQFIKWLLMFERYCFTCVSVRRYTNVKIQTMPTNARKKTALKTDAWIVNRQTQRVLFRSISFRFKRNRTHRLDSYFTLSSMKCLIFRNIFISFIYYLNRHNYLIIYKVQDRIFL